MLVQRATPSNASQWPIAFASRLGLTLVVNDEQAWGSAFIMNGSQGKPAPRVGPGDAVPLAPEDAGSGPSGVSLAGAGLETHPTAPMPPRSSRTEVR